RRRTDGRRAEEVIEAHAVLRKAIEIRRADLGIAGAAERPGALVVAEDEQDVRVFRPPACHARSPPCASRPRLTPYCTIGRAGSPVFDGSTSVRLCCTIDCAS